MFHLLALLAATAAPVAAHPCLGDFVYRSGKEEISIGIRVRQAPDQVEILFSDYGSVKATQVVWNADTLVAVDPTDKSNIVLVCNTQTPVLVLPAEEYSLARTFKMRRVTGSLWEVGKREGWLSARD